MNAKETINLTVPKFFSKNLNQQQYPFILVLHEKHGDIYGIINSEVEFGKACLKILSDRLEDGWYEDEILDTLNKTIKEFNVTYAIYFINSIRSDYEYEKISIEYPADFE